ncbi:xylose isomerase family protein [Striga asiatica]|uniref:Xylose isomerase family protein n=1 Tax=Striga asiatica TaxID=4170 RepID=A0A5A7R5Q3_STRAF|nr:xylose isomerase family protein [Striga asiatica]
MRSLKMKKVEFLLLLPSFSECSSHYSGKRHYFQQIKRSRLRLAHQHTLSISGVIAIVMLVNGKESFFPGIPKIKYEGSSSKNPLSFKWYAEEEILGKKDEGEF